MQFINKFSESENKITDNGREFFMFNCVELSLILGEELNEHRKRGNFCDFRLVSKDKINFNAHKCVLASSSGFFKAMFNVDLCENASNSCELENISATLLEKLLSYMYNGSIIIQKQDLKEIYLGSRYLLLSDLSKFCLKQLQDLINATTYLDLWKFAENNAIQELSEKCILFCANNLRDCFEDPAFLSLRLDNIEALFAVNSFKGFENDAAKYILQWIQKNSMCESELLKLIFKFKLNEIPEKIIRPIISDYMSDEKCNNFVLHLAKASMIKVLTIENRHFTFEEKPRKHIFLITENSIVLDDIQSLHMPDDRYAYSHAVSNNNLIAITGGIERNTRYIMEKCYSYVPSTNKWTEFTSKPFKVYYHRSIFIDNTLFVCGGCDHKNSELSDLYAIDINTEQWSNCKTMNYSRSSFGLSHTKGCLYMFGGRGNNSIEIFDPWSDKFLNVSVEYPFNSRTKTVAIDNLIYCFNSNVSEMHVFDTRTNSFIDNIKLHFNYHWHDIYEENGHIYIYGQGGDTLRCYKFDTLNFTSTLCFEKQCPAFPNGYTFALGYEFY